MGDARRGRADEAAAVPVVADFDISGGCDKPGVPSNTAVAFIVGSGGDAVIDNNVATRGCNAVARSAGVAAG